MIFSGGLCEKVMDGSKTVTRRPYRHGTSCPYRVGRDYAVQPGRGKLAVGRIEIRRVGLVKADAITDGDAKLEGFEEASGFLDRWRDMYGSVGGFCWRIEFRLKEA